MQMISRIQSKCENKYVKEVASEEMEGGTLIKRKSFKREVSGEQEVTGENAGDKAQPTSRWEQTNKGNNRNFTKSGKQI